MFSNHSGITLEGSDKDNKNISPNLEIKQVAHFSINQDNEEGRQGKLENV